jgi:hypothetical protein
MIQIEDTPTLPRWIQRQVDKGEDRDALVIAEYLNNQDDSPWKGKILMANETNSAATTIKQNSFVTSIKKYILSANNPLMHTDETIKRNKILNNYWKAISNILNEDDILSDTALYKTIGLDLFNQISPAVFAQLFLVKDFRVEKIESVLRNAFRNLDPEYIKVGFPDFWKKGKDASGLNQAAVSKYASELNKAITNEKDDLSEIEI